ncbi:hypothetical protein T4C_10385 [Trichinella pseudospiralis]|uniref:Uncharacterized protein n=1 Tax=Trichinella pseudospiralis TaxID=6337 RepID=A0A0V1JQD6_TRIPS|nr:hypothetical protein T4C_10385 [Trichinella pseudospiralis]
MRYGSEENNSENPDDRKWTADGTKQIKTGHEVCGSPWVPILWRRKKKIGTSTSNERMKRLDRIVRWTTEIKSGINEFCEMASMPGVVHEIFKAGGGWRDQKWAPPRSVKLPSLRQGRVQTLPRSLGE